MAESVNWDQRFIEQSWPSEPDPSLVDLVRPLPPGRALDLGSGPGRNAIWLAQKGWTVTAVDSSAVGLAQAADRARAAGVILDLVRADMEQWSAPAAAFDLVVLANIHPRPDLRPGLYARAVAALSPGGHLFVVGHHLDNLGRGGPSDADRLFTVEKLGPDLEGVVLERLERVERPGSGDVPDVAVVAWGRLLVTGARADS
ncbi:MAG: class I SAM-dependent methyltransferase [Candidatus Dormibacteria bacterium]